MSCFAWSSYLFQVYEFPYRKFERTDWFSKRGNKDYSSNRYFLLYLPGAFLRGGCLSGRGRGADPLFPPASLYQPVSSVYRRTDRSVQGYFRGNLISTDQPGRGGPGNQPFCGGLGEESGAGQYLRAFGRSVYSDGCRCGGCVPVHPERRGPFRKAGGDSLDGRAVLHASNLFGFFRLFRYGHRYGLDDRLPLQGKL